MSSGYRDGREGLTKQTACRVSCIHAPDSIYRVTPRLVITSETSSARDERCLGFALCLGPLSLPLEPLGVHDAWEGSIIADG